jgi:hypothetical protein
MLAVTPSFRPLVGLLLLFSCSSLQAADARKLPEPLPDHRVVFRVSDRLLNSLMDNAAIDRQTDVREVILGTSIYGKARVQGKPDVQLVPSVDDATFHLTLEGTIHSQTIGYNGPVIVHSRSVTTFTATRPVVFEPGKGFYGLPSQVSAHTESVVEGISSTRRGLIGRIITRRARKIEAAQHAETTEIARQKAEARIKVGFDRSSEQRLARLNQVADFRTLATAALRARGGEEPRYACCTTPHYLQFAARFGDSGAAIELPAAERREGAAIEVWVHQSLLENPLFLGAEGVTPQTESKSLAWPLAGVTEYLRSSAIRTEAFPTMFSNPVRVTKAEDWTIFQVDVTTQADAAPPLSVAPVVRASPESDPIPAKRRIWTSGNFTADAEFLSLEDGVVRLRRPTGIRTSIPLEKLSLADRTWITNHLSIDR